MFNWSRSSGDHGKFNSAFWENVGRRCCTIEFTSDSRHPNEYQPPIGSKNRKSGPPLPPHPPPSLGTYLGRVRMAQRPNTIEYYAVRIVHIYYDNMHFAPGIQLAADKPPTWILMNEWDILMGSNKTIKHRYSCYIPYRRRTYTHNSKILGVL